MYTRSFTGVEEASTPIPPGYDGVAFDGSKNSEKRDTGIALEEIPVIKEEAYDAPCSKGQRNGGGLFSGILPMLSSLFQRGGNAKIASWIPKIGAEEILIIATALFLFLSRDGDRECGVILLLLLIVN